MQNTLFKTKTVIYSQIDLKIVKKEQPDDVATFQYGKNKVLIKQDDCISFLNSLPVRSVDLIVTDPAYSGMNNKLRLGKGRIVGKYNEKGSENGRWFGEFEDTEENYEKFLLACKRVLKKETGHIYIMFDSFSLLTLGRH